MKTTALILALLLCFTGTVFAMSAGFMGGGQTVAAAADPNAVSKSDANLLGLWLFEAASPNIGDDYKNNYELAENSGPARVADVGAPLGTYSGDFISTDPDYLTGDTDGSITGSADWSLSFWYMGDADHDAIIFHIRDGSGDNQVQVSANAEVSNKLYFNTKNSSWGTSTGSDTNVSTDGSTWQHWVITYTLSTTTAAFYLNGATDGTGSIAASGAVAAYVGGIGVGASNGASTPFNGHLDEVAWFNRILTPDEITSIYTNGIVD